MTSRRDSAQWNDSADQSLADTTTDAANTSLRWLGSIAAQVAPSVLTSWWSSGSPAASTPSSSFSFRPTRRSDALPPAADTTFPTATITRREEAPPNRRQTTTTRRTVVVTEEQQMETGRERDDARVRIRPARDMSDGGVLDDESRIRGSLSGGDGRRSPANVRAMGEAAANRRMRIDTTEVAPSRYARPSISPKKEKDSPAASLLHPSDHITQLDRFVSRFPENRTAESRSTSENAFVSSEYHRKRAAPTHGLDDDEGGEARGAATGADDGRRLTTPAPKRLRIGEIPSLANVGRGDTHQQPRFRHDTATRADDTTAYSTRHVTTTDSPYDRRRRTSGGGSIVDRFNESARSTASERERERRQPPPRETTPVTQTRRFYEHATGGTPVSDAKRIPMAETTSAVRQRLSSVPRSGGRLTGPPPLQSLRARTPTRAQLISRTIASDRSGGAGTPGSGGGWASKPYFRRLVDDGGRRRSTASTDGDAGSAPDGLWSTGRQTVRGAVMKGADRQTTAAPALSNIFSARLLDDDETNDDERVVRLPAPPQAGFLGGDDDTIRFTFAAPRSLTAASAYQRPQTDDSKSAHELSPVKVQQISPVPKSISVVPVGRESVPFPKLEQASPALPPTSNNNSKSTQPWTCGTCYVSNPADKDQCICCLTARPSSTQATDGTAAKKPADVAAKWTCAACFVANAADGDCCVCCSSIRPSTGSKGATLPAQEKPTGGESSSAKTSSAPTTSTKWTCGACFVSNPADKHKCVCCAGDRPAAGGGGAAATPASAGEIKTALPAAKSSSWSCAACFITNSPDASRCACCQTPRPGAAASTTPAEPPVLFGQRKTQLGVGATTEEDWNCTTCFVSNRPSTSSCVACNSPKPGNTYKAVKFGFHSPAVAVKPEPPSNLTNDDSLFNKKQVHFAEPIASTKTITPSPSPCISFGFGKPAAVSASDSGLVSTAVTPLPPTFGGTTASSAAPSVATDSTAQKTAPMFSFGSTAAVAPSAAVGATGSALPTPSFAFGASTAGASTAAPTSTAAPPASLFPAPPAFAAAKDNVSAAGPAAVPPFSLAFATPAVTSTVAAGAGSLPSLGFPSSAGDTTTTAALTTTTPSFGFKRKEPSSTLGAKPGDGGASLFGASSSTATAAPFSLLGQTTATNGPGGFGAAAFGATAAAPTSSTQPLFGAPPVAAGAIAPSFANFNTAARSDEDAPGAKQSKQNGGVSNGPPQATFSFGKDNNPAAATATPAGSLFAFGASAAKLNPPAAPAAGTMFGMAAANKTAPSAGQAAGGFNFTAAVNPANNQTNQGAASGGFNFSAAAAPSAVPASFSFGAAAPALANTSVAAAQAPGLFQFGAAVGGQPTDTQAPPVANPFSSDAAASTAAPSASSAPGRRMLAARRKFNPSRRP